VNKPSIEATVYYGTYGEKSKTCTVPIGEGLMRDLMDSVELSDDPWSVLLASPGVFGGRGDAITIRRKAFEMRHEVAKEIGAAVARELPKIFGTNDKVDGYKKEDPTAEDLRLRRIQEQ